MAVSLRLDDMGLQGSNVDGWTHVSLTVDLCIGGTCSAPELNSHRRHRRNLLYATTIKSEGSGDSMSSGHYSRHGAMDNPDTCPTKPLPLFIGAGNLFDGYFQASTSGSRPCSGSCCGNGVIDAQSEVGGTLLHCLLSYISVVFVILLRNATMGTLLIQISARIPVC